jgi:hypothetical protein
VTDAAGFASAGGALALATADEARGAPASMPDEPGAPEEREEPAAEPPGDLHAAAPGKNGRIKQDRKTRRRRVHGRARTTLLYYAYGRRRPR